MGELLSDEEWADYIDRLKGYRYERKGFPERSFAPPAAAERAARLKAEEERDALRGNLRHRTLDSRPRPYYDAAHTALEAAHRACFNHPDRDVLGMSSGPFSGVNQALGIVATLEAKAADLETQLAKAREERPRLQLGDRIEISAACRNYADWRGWSGFVCGLQAKPATGEIDVTISEHWPPRGLGDMTDGFAPEDLTLIPATDRAEGEPT